PTFMPGFLVTGFLPFAGEARNPSGEIAMRLRGEHEGAWSVEGAVLPVERERAFAEALSAVRRVRPAIVVALGLAGGRAVIGVERFAQNLDDYADPDEAGAQPRGEPVVRSAPALLRTSLPEDEIARAIREAGVPALVSEDAGSFLCNHLYYRLLHLAATEGTDAPATIFLHLPPLPESVALRGEGRASMARETSERAVRAALRALAARQRS
ncbi:MAG: pyroglutamyl-peptidase I, partial [Candidatus Binatia bacterium]